MIFSVKMFQYAFCTAFFFLAMFVPDSSSIMKRKFGIEYSRGDKFPNMENRYNGVQDIPDTLKNLDSFKFDRSIEKAENYESGKVFKLFEDRSTTDPESKLTCYFRSYQTIKTIKLLIE